MLFLCVLAQYLDFDKSVVAMKKFKCVNCRKEFVAEESLDLVCPNCHSDNITIVVNTQWASVVLKVLAGLASVAAGYFIVYFLKAISVVPITGNTAYEPYNEQYTNVVQVPEEDDYEQIEQIINEPEVIETTFEKPGQEDYIYSFLAHCNLAGKKKIIYELMQQYDGEVIQTSEDGWFRNLQPNVNGYYFRVRILDDGRISDLKLVTGFVPKPQEVTDKMTADEIETLINSQQASMNKSGKIAHDVYIKVVNDNSEEKFDNLQDIENQLLYGIWSYIKVVSVGYNDRGQISSINIERSI